MGTELSDLFKISTLTFSLVRTLGLVFEQNYSMNGQDYETPE